MITVVNRRVDSRGVYIGRPSPLGNPFSHLPNTLAEHRVASRDEAVDAYARWIEDKLRDPDSPQSREFDRLVALAMQGDLQLVCWCAPARCHGHVLKTLIEQYL